MVKNKYRDDKKGPNSVATVLFPDLLYQMHFELNFFCACDDFHVFLLKHKIRYFAHFQFYNFIGTFPRFNLYLGLLTKNSLYYLYEFS